jgi:hypothetical protein
MHLLDPSGPLNRDFDSYQLMPRINDFGAMIEHVHFSEERPSFWLLNVGETHYPYATADEPTDAWPRLPGTPGILNALRDGRPLDLPPLFSEAQLTDLQQRQVRALEAVDRLFPLLLARLPANTAIVVTADHGELFGEDGYFGHGPIQHEKVFEVPFIDAVFTD